MYIYKSQNKTLNLDHLKDRGEPCTKHILETT